jgi:hypothetical protein
MSIQSSAFRPDPSRPTVVTSQPAARKASAMIGPSSSDGSNTTRGPRHLHMRVTADVVLSLPGPANDIAWPGPFAGSSQISRACGLRSVAPIRQPGPPKRPAICRGVAKDACPRLSVTPGSSGRNPPPGSGTRRLRDRRHSFQATAPIASASTAGGIAVPISSVLHHQFAGQ